MHGEKDLVVPFESAHDMADRADGTLYQVPGAYHSWMLANPRHGADMLRQLLAAELGDVLRDAERLHGVMDARGWQDVLLTVDSPLHSLDGRQDTVGVEAPDPVELDRLRSATRTRPSSQRGKRRVRWLNAWRRKRASTLSGGTADIALPAD